jgi:hypothetical protein
MGPYTIGYKTKNKIIKGHILLDFLMNDIWLKIRVIYIFLGLILLKRVSSIK